MNQSSPLANGGALAQKLQEVSEQLNQYLDELLPQPENGEARVIEAMRYSALSGGKRLRPFLTVSSANLFSVSREASLQTAAAIELMHTYSLIHDDLPAMDNDDLRRGQPSCHRKFDEATAILAGDALQSFAFQILADSSTHPDSNVRCELVRTLAIASGCRGMVGGQMMDMLAENKTLETDEIIRLQRMKTGELFALSCEAGAILGKASRNLRNALRGYAHDMGLAFQITDDLLDVEGTRDETGKSVNKDKVAGKATLVSVLGVDQARAQAQMLAAQAKRYLDVFDGRADILRELADFVVTRRK
jgi:farnesyl diphosphate synthase